MIEPSKSESIGVGLRLFTPGVRPSDRPTDWLSPAMRVSQLWEIYGKPVVCKAKNLSRPTIEMYADTVRYWTQLTRNRGLEDIEADDSADFLEGLRAQPGIKDEFLSGATVARHAGDLGRILELAGPRIKGKWSKFGTGLLDVAPFIEVPERPESAPQGDFTLEEVTAILQACKTAKLHDDFKGDSGVFWRALILFLFYTGLRIRETMELRWDDLDRQMLLIPAAISKTKRGRYKYLHPAALAAIEPLQGQGPRIFNWPNWPSAGAWRWLHRRRQQLVAAAGLPEHRQFGFHGLRKCHATLLYEGEDLATSGPSAAQLSLGHESEGVTLGHYVNIHTQIGKDIKRQQAAIDRLPLLG